MSTINVKVTDPREEWEAREWQPGKTLVIIDNDYAEDAAGNPARLLRLAEVH